jgi:hypothetical protein
MWGSAAIEVACVVPSTWRINGSKTPTTSLHFEQRGRPSAVLAPADIGRASRLDRSSQARRARTLVVENYGLTSPAPRPARHALRGLRPGTFMRGALHGGRRVEYGTRVAPSRHRSRCPPSHRSSPSLSRTPILAGRALNVTSVLLHGRSAGRRKRRTAATFQKHSSGSA